LHTGELVTKMYFAQCYTFCIDNHSY